MPKYPERDAFLETIRASKNSFACPACGRHYGRYALPNHLYDVHHLTLTHDGELVQVQAENHRATQRGAANAHLEVAGYGLTGQLTRVEKIPQETLDDGRARVLVRSHISLR